MPEDSSSEERAFGGAAAVAPPPRTAADFDWLDRIRRYSRIGAVVAAVFLLLLIVPLLWLYNLNIKIATRRTELTETQQQLDVAKEELQSKQAEIKVKKEEVESLQKQIDVYKATLGSGEQAKQEVEATAEKVAAQGGGWKQVPARIYIQVGDEEQLKRASGLARQLQSKGFIVPDIENVGGRDKLPANTQLRCYAGKWSQDDIDVIFGLFQGQGVNISKPTPEPAPKARPRHYEIWVGRDF